MINFVIRDKNGVCQDLWFYFLTDVKTIFLNTLHYATNIKNWKKFYITTNKTWPKIKVKLIKQIWDSVICVTTFVLYWKNVIFIPSNGGLKQFTLSHCDEIVYFISSPRQSRAQNLDWALAKSFSDEYQTILFVILQITPHNLLKNQMIITNFKVKGTLWSWGYP
jgi:hypothetical protein